MTRSRRLVAAVLATSLRNGTGEPVAVVLYGSTLVVGGVFFNAIWWHARRAHLLGDTMTPDGARRLGRRFVAGPLLYLAGTLIGAFLPVAGIVVFAALILFYWLPVTPRSRSSGREGDATG